MLGWLHADFDSHAPAFSSLLHSLAIPAELAALCLAAAGAPELRTAPNLAARADAGMAAADSHALQGVTPAQPFSVTNELKGRPVCLRALQQERSMDLISACAIFAAGMQGLLLSVSCL